MDILLYGTDYCSLCEQAEAVIHEAMVGRRYRIVSVDISVTEAMLESYGLRIPVIGLEHGSGVELDWPFDSVQLLAFIEAQQEKQHGRI